MAYDKRGQIKLPSDFTRQIISRTGILILQHSTFIAIATASVFVIGFYQNPVVHEIFHDFRHIMGFACH